LALDLSRNGEYQEAIDLLFKVIVGFWSAAFQEIEITALFELNNVIAKADRQGYKYTLPPQLPTTLVKNLDVDLRISMAWYED
jgi:hypothetical protein